MPTLKLPFEAPKSMPKGDALLKGGLIEMLSVDFQEACRKNLYLLEYLHMLPIEEIGIPKYYVSPGRELGEEKTPNIIYPTQGGVFVHIYPQPTSERHWYIPLEPILTTNMDALMPRIEEALLDYTKDFEDLETDDEKKAAFDKALDKICREGKSELSEGGGAAYSKGKSGGFLDSIRKTLKLSRGGGKITLTRDEIWAVKYLVKREKVGVGLLDPLLGDTFTEDVSCSGIGQIFIEHKIFKSVLTAIDIPTMEELDDFAKRMSERMKRPVTLNKPIQDATLPDGSRINIVYGEDVSRRGTNFTIRRAMGVPTSILEIVGFGTMTYQMAAYMSLVLEEDMNVFVAGETASGKTTTINAITAFMTPETKIVSIEDTPELMVPHKNWLREVSREGGEKGAAVGMFDLLKAALRQRPNMIIIGEIRGSEGLIAFQAMQTGHGVMATFHAASVEKLIQRLTGDPINVPKNYIDCLNVVLIQSAVKLPNGKGARRV
ncbi:MAG: type II/IV secretion system ATPase subunit, partial [Chloroflexota bacterium]|nr:type II/IV secretion system ATPase subunit [Chloroflexota bacterium]